jgi:hypothetical protein
MCTKDEYIDIRTFPSLLPSLFNLQHSIIFSKFDKTLAVPGHSKFTVIDFVQSVIATWKLLEIWKWEGGSVRA